MVSVVDAELAEDGVDEIITVMMDATNIPDWSSFVANGRTAALVADEGPSWPIELGRFTGTSPHTGTTYDDPAVRLLHTIPPRPSVTVAASGPELDLWLWGRRGLDPTRVTGDAADVADVRAAAAAATQ